MFYGLLLGKRNCQGAFGKPPCHVNTKVQCLGYYVHEENVVRTGLKMKPNNVKVEVNEIKVEYNDKQQYEL